MPHIVSDLSTCSLDLFICGSFNYSFSSSYSVVPNGRLIDQ